MSAIKDILEQERRRDDMRQCRAVYLYQEGSFLRAYNWSAWLCVRFINDFKVTNRMFHGEQEPVALIGFPPTSLQKFTPEGAELSQLSERCVMMLLPEVMIPDGYEADLMGADFADWKTHLPLPEAKPRQRGDRQGERPSEPQGEAVTLTSLMQRVLAFPLEHKTPFECMEFLSDLRLQLTKIL